MSFENNALAFSEVNPDTGKRWTCAELHSALNAETSKLLVAESKLLEKEVNDVLLKEQHAIISWPAQSANIRARWAIHLDEFSIARRQLRNLGSALKARFNQYKGEFNDFSLLKKS